MRTSGNVFSAVESIVCDLLCISSFYTLGIRATSVRFITVRMMRLGVRSRRCESDTALLAVMRSVVVAWSQCIALGELDAWCRRTCSGIASFLDINAVS